MARSIIERDLKQAEEKVRTVRGVYAPWDGRGVAVTLGTPAPSAASPPPVPASARR